LPAGHPDISKLRADNAGGTDSLPAGHPAISGQRKAGPLAAGSLPAGHPALPNDDGTVPAPEGVAPGTLLIQATQGTPGAKPIGAESATVEYYVGDRQVKKLTARLNPDGSLKLPDVPYNLTIQPIVKITHGGVEYVGVGQPMDSQHPSEKLDLTVYESTEQSVDWNLQMRHVMIHPSGGGLEVTEVLVVNTPGDRAWLGKPDGKGGHTTFAVRLPEGAKDVKLTGAFQGGPASVTDGKVVNPQALVPGQAEYAMSYTVPATAGRAEVFVTAPAATDNMMVFVDDDGTSVTTQGLTAAGAMPMNDGQKMRCYTAKALEAQQSVAITVGDLTKVSAAADAPAITGPSPKTTTFAKHAAAIGAGAILLLGGALIFAKTPKARTR
jgi:hypothetical protein